MASDNLLLKKNPLQRTTPVLTDITIPCSVGYRFVDGVRQMRILVAIGVLLTAHFVWWFADADHMGYPLLFWLLTVSLSFKLLRMLHEWYHYVQVSVPVAPTPVSRPRSYTVDILTTACPGEPLAMIEGTLRAMQAITYPHTSYLCDEGNDPYLRQLCAELGVTHVTRQQKINAKAGNINNALRQATGELCVVLDPDHAPTPDFLDQVVAYFADPTVGYVQVVQAYGNQEESLIARGAAEQTYHFYGPLMMGMNAYNTAQAIGANCTFRRAALDSIGGHAAGLTEDMHTAMRLHAKGWKSVYAPVIVSRGLVPASLAAYYAQQLKWARGSFELLMRVYPTLFASLSWRQRLHYATLPLYFFSGVVALIDLLVPIIALVLAEFPWHLSLPEFVLHLTPVVLVSLLIRYNAQRWLREPQEAGLHLAGGFLRIGTWWIYCLGLLYTLLRVRVPYIPTPKEGRESNEWQLSIPNLLMAIVCVAAARYGHYLTQTPYALLMMALAMSNAAILGASVAMAQHQLLKEVMRFITSRRPLQKFLLKLDQIVIEKSDALLPRLRTGAIYISFFLISAHSIISVGVSLWRNHSVPSPDLIWARTGLGKIRVGYAATSMTTAWPAVAHTTLPDSTFGVQELRLQSGLGPKVSPMALQQLDAQGKMPILSWDVKNGTFGDAAWQHSVAVIRKRNKPVLLRPLIEARSAATYRVAWQKLVTRFRAAGDTSAVWVWTPPRTDSVAAYFPGSAYVDWVAADFLSSTPSTMIQKYSSLRLQLAERAEVNSKPILFMAPAQPNKAIQAQSFTKVYPEIRAIIYNKPISDQPALGWVSVNSLFTK
jgi:cellulose synthase (UDP-forming)